MESPGKKKRVSLPVVGNSGRSQLGSVDTGEGVPTARAPGAWIILGALATFALMLPLLYVITALLGAVYRAPIGAPQTLLPAAIGGVLSVGAGAYAGGYIVGRFGGRAGTREGALAGILAGVVMWAMSRMLLGVVIVFVTWISAYLGARIGKRSRKPGDNIGA
jgi:hypothetical protein